MSVELAQRLDGPESGPPLVLSGSLGTTTAFWEPQLPALASFRVLRHDHPGHGASPVPGDAFTVADLGEALLAVLDALGIERFSFCGLSLGGMIGIWLGAQAAERVDRLVLCCTGAVLGTPELWRERAATVRAEGTQALVDGARERWFTAPFRESTAAAGCLDQLRSTDRESYARCCEAIGATDLRAELELISAPTLVISGEEDPVTPPDVLAELARVPRVRAVPLPHAAHLANVEQPAAFNEALLAHLTAEQRVES